jgi:hypothetical protein
MPAKPNDQTIQSVGAAFPVLSLSKGSRDKSMGVPLYDAMRYLPCLSRAQ